MIHLGSLDFTAYDTFLSSYKLQILRRKQQMSFKQKLCDKINLLLLFVVVEHRKMQHLLPCNFVG